MPRGINRTPSNSYTYKGSGQSAGGATYGGSAQSSFVSPGKQSAKEAMKRTRKPLSMKHCTSIIDGLKTIYFNKVSQSLLDLGLSYLTQVCLCILLHHRLRPG